MKKRIIITAGDPAGIGPEIIVKLLSSSAVSRLCIPVVAGDASILERAARFARVRPGMDIIDDSLAGAVVSRPRRFYLLDMKTEGISGTRIGRTSPVCGRASVSYIKKAVELVQAGKADAMVTAPINKHSMNSAGFDYPGHTELLAELTRTKDYCMMLAWNGLRVSFVTCHCGISEVHRLLTVRRVKTVLELTVKAVRMSGVRGGRIAVLGLNPHSGENGLFGREEIEIIKPAMKKARPRGFELVGPVPPDTAFIRERMNKFCAFVCMYHDQGHIPFKMLAFDRGVNVTLGLPIIRTSVDHGTAFDIAGTGRASPESLNQAVRLAVAFAEREHGG